MGFDCGIFSEFLALKIFFQNSRFQLSLGTPQIKMVTDGYEHFDIYLAYLYYYIKCMSFIKMYVYKL